MTADQDHDNRYKSKILALIPKEHRLPGLLFLAIEVVFVGLAYGSESTVKIVAILGIVVVACVFLVRFFPRSSIQTVKQKTNIQGSDESFSNSIGIIRDILSISGNLDPLLWSLSQTIFDAFKAQSRKFKVFELSIVSGLNKEELVRKSLPFDLVLNGYLKMRMDRPYRIRTAYDASLLFAISTSAISDDFTSRLANGAKRLLTTGVDLANGENFEPWDTFLFVVGKDFEKNIKPIKHEDYINIFLLTTDGRFINASPHEWMDEVLKAVCLSWNPKSTQN